MFNFTLMDVYEKIELVLSHIQNVQRNCQKLGVRLMKHGETELGVHLIANGLIHDNSKFKGIEFEHLFHGDPLLSEVVKHHQSVNPHHPEYWGGIHKMPDLYLAELVCDCCARSSEFGTNARDWFFTVAAEKYKFKPDDVVGKKIEFFIDKLLDKNFK